MLRVCRERLAASGLSNWQVEVADHRQLPVPDHSADLAVSGWSVSYLAVWNQDNGQAELDQMAGGNEARPAQWQHDHPVRVAGHWK